MKIRDLGKLGMDGEPLNIETDKIALRRYTISDGKYYDADKSVVRNNETETSGTIFQNDGVIQSEDAEESTAADFKPVSQSDSPKNYYVIDHPDGVAAAGRFAEMVRGDVYAVKGTINMDNPEEDSNHKDMIKGGFDGFGSNQDENNDNLEGIGSVLKNAALSSVNIGGIGTTVKGIVDTIKGNENSFDVAIQKLVSWKNERYKQIHMYDYKESQYYNEISNVANTKNKLKRGDLGYTASFSATGANLMAKFGDNDYPEDLEEIAELNTIGQFNMYTSKPGTKVKSKDLDSQTPYPEAIYNKNIGQDVGKYRDDYGKENNEIFALQNDHSLNRANENPFSPKKLSDAQARMVSMLKYKNSYLESVGCIYVKPFYNSEGFNNFIIPFEFKPEISEGSLTAKYQAENLLNRLGAMQVYTGTELSTLTITTTYMALAPDDPTLEDTSRQFNTNAWEFNWTDSRIDSIEWQLRSLVFPALTQGNGYMVKPPIVQVMMGGTKELPTIGTLYKYPKTELDKYLKVSGADGGPTFGNSYFDLKGGKTYPQWKKYVVTSVQIDKLDNDIMSYPSLYTRYALKRDGQEGDGIGANIYPSDSNGNAILSGTTDASASLGSNVTRRRGFKATIQLTEVTENFLDIVPDFRAYYNAAKELSENADLTASAAKSLMGVSDNPQDIIDALTADANTLISQNASLEERIKKLLERAYIVASHYCEPSEEIFSLVKTIYLIGAKDTSTPGIGNVSNRFGNDGDYSFDSLKDKIQFAPTSDGNEFIYESEAPYQIKKYGTIMVTKDNIVTSFFSDGSSKKDKDAEYDYEYSSSDKKKNLEIQDFVLHINDCPFKADKSKSLACLTNEDLVKYLNDYFDAYFILKDIDPKNIKANTKRNALISAALKCYENGGEIFGYSKGGLKKSLCKIPAISDVVNMIRNSLINLKSLYDSLEQKVLEVTDLSTTVPVTSIDVDLMNGNVIGYLKGEDGKEIEIPMEHSAHSYCNTNGSGGWLNDMFSNDHLAIDVSSGSQDAWTKPFTVNYTKENLKKMYENIMKEYNGIPVTSTIEKFQEKYCEKKENDKYKITKQCDKFISQEYNGLEDMAGIININESDEGKLDGYDQKVSVARLAVKQAKGASDLNNVENALSEEEENITDE